MSQKAESGRLLRQQSMLKHTAETPNHISEALDLCKDQNAGCHTAMPWSCFGSILDVPERVRKHRHRGALSIEFFLAYGVSSSHFAKGPSTQLAIFALGSKEISRKPGRLAVGTEIWKRTSTTFSSSGRTGLSIGHCANYPLVGLGIRCKSVNAWHGCPLRRQSWL